MLVTGPMRERLDEVIHFHTLLKQNHMEVAAVVVNRVHPPVHAGAVGGTRPRLPEPLRRKVEETLEEHELLAAQDARGLAQLAAACPDAR